MNCHCTAPSSARLVAAAGRALAGRADGEVGAARGERVPGAAVDLLEDAQPRAAGGGVEFIDQAEQPFGRDQIVDGDTQLDLVARRHALDARLDLAGGDEQPPALAQQLAPGLGELGAVAAAVEQRHVEVVLELLHGIGDRRGHAVQLLGGGGEAALAVDGVQHQQRIQRQTHGHSNSLKDSGKIIRYPRGGGKDSL
jgi:hypothetical protein